MFVNHQVTMRQESLEKRHEIKIAVLGNLIAWSLIFLTGFIEYL